MANTLKLHRHGAVGFIDWLDRMLPTFARLRSPACDYNGNDNTYYEANKCALQPHEHNVAVGRQTQFTVVWKQEPESSSNKTGNGRTYRSPFVHDGNGVERLSNTKAANASGNRTSSAQAKNWPSNVMRSNETQDQRARALRRAPCTQRVDGKHIGGRSQRGSRFAASPG